MKNRLKDFAKVYTTCDPYNYMETRLKNVKLVHKFVQLCGVTQVLR